jgi:hypothetical protein
MIKNWKSWSGKNFKEQTEDCGEGRLQYHRPGRLSFVRKYYGWSLLRSYSSRSSHPQRQKAIWSTLAIAGAQWSKTEKSSSLGILNWTRSRNNYRLSNSPDANPLENLWSIRKGCVETLKTTNLGELENLLHEECDKVVLVIVYHLIKSRGMFRFPKMTISEITKNSTIFGGRDVWIYIYLITSIWFK